MKFSGKVGIEPMNNRELLFKLDVGDRRGHDQKLFKRRFRLDLRKFVFSNRVVNNWNSKSAQCVNYCTINSLNSTLQSIRTGNC